MSGKDVNEEEARRIQEVLQQLESEGWTEGMTLANTPQKLETSYEIQSIEPPTADLSYQGVGDTSADDLFADCAGVNDSQLLEEEESKEQPQEENPIPAAQQQQDISVSEKGDSVRQADDSNDPVRESSAVKVESVDAVQDAIEQSVEVIDLQQNEDLDEGRGEVDADVAQAKLDQNIIVEEMFVPAISPGGAKVVAAQLEPEQHVVQEDFKNGANMESTPVISVQTTDEQHESNWTVVEVSHMAAADGEDAPARVSQPSIKNDEGAGVESGSCSVWMTGHKMKGSTVMYLVGVTIDGVDWMCERSHDDFKALDKALKSPSAPAQSTPDAGAEDQTSEESMTKPPIEPEENLLLPTLPKKSTFMGAYTLVGKTQKIEEFGRQLCSYLRCALLSARSSNNQRLFRTIQAFLEVERYLSENVGLKQSTVGPLQRGPQGHFRIVLAGDTENSPRLLTSTSALRFGVTSLSDGSTLTLNGVGKQGVDVVQVCCEKIRGFGDTPPGEMYLEMVMEGPQQCRLRVGDEGIFTTASPFTSLNVVCWGLGQSMRGEPVFLGHKRLSMHELVGGRKDLTRVMWVPMAPPKSEVEAPKEQRFEVIVPATAVPGETFTVDLGLGQFWQVRCPPTHQPGSVLQLLLPVAPVAGTALMRVTYTCAQNFKLQELARERSEISRYMLLVELLCDGDMCIPRSMLEAVPDDVEVLRPLLRILRVYNADVRLALRLVQIEAEEARDEESLMKGNSLACTVCVEVLTLCSRHYVPILLEPLLMEVCAASRDLETDVAKVTPEVAAANAVCLSEVCARFFSAILASFAQLDEKLCKFLSSISDVVTDYCPLQGGRLITWMLMARLFSPAVSLPRAFGMKIDDTYLPVQKTLRIVAQALSDSGSQHITSDMHTVEAPISAVVEEYSLLLHHELTRKLLLFQSQAIPEIGNGGTGEGPRFKRRPSHGGSEVIPDLKDLVSVHASLMRNWSVMRSAQRGKEADWSPSASEARAKHEELRGILIEMAPVPKPRLVVERIACEKIQRTVREWQYVSVEMQDWVCTSKEDGDQENQSTGLMDTSTSVFMPLPSYVMLPDKARVVLWLERFSQHETQGFAQFAQGCIESVSSWQLLKTCGVTFKNGNFWLGKEAQCLELSDLQLVPNASTQSVWVVRRNDDDTICLVSLDGRYLSKKLDRGSRRLQFATTYDEDSGTFILRSGELGLCPKSAATASEPTRLDMQPLTDSTASWRVQMVPQALSMAEDAARAKGVLEYGRVMCLRSWFGFVTADADTNKVYADSTSGCTAKQALVLCKSSLLPNSNEVFSIRALQGRAGMLGMAQDLIENNLTRYLAVWENFKLGLVACEADEAPSFVFEEVLGEESELGTWKSVRIRSVQAAGLYLVVESDGTLHAKSDTDLDAAQAGASRQIFEVSPFDVEAHIAAQNAPAASSQSQERFWKLDTLVKVDDVKSTGDRMQKSGANMARGLKNAFKGAFKSEGQENVDTANPPVSSFSRFKGSFKWSKSSASAPVETPADSSIPANSGPTEASTDTGHTLTPGSDIQQQTFNRANFDGAGNEELKILLRPAILDLDQLDRENDPNFYS